MVGINTLKEGDTVVFINGGRSKVTIKNSCLHIGGVPIHHWHHSGKKYTSSITDLDILEIIKKPEPKIEVLYLQVNGDYRLSIRKPAGSHYKIILTDGEPSIEKINQ